MSSKKKNITLNNPRPLPFTSFPIHYSLTNRPNSRRHTVKVPESVVNKNEYDTVQVGTKVSEVHTSAFFRIYFSET